MSNINTMNINELRKIAKVYIDTLTFDELAKIVDDFCDIEMFMYVINRMDQLDKKRFLEFAENY